MTAKEFIEAIPIDIALAIIIGLILSIVIWKVAEYFAHKERRKKYEAFCKWTDSILENLDIEAEENGK